MAKARADVQRQAAATERSLATQMQAAGKRMSSVGRTLTTHVSLPAAAVGAASVKMALDFNTSMEKIRNLVGVSQKQVDQWSKELIALGPKVGKSPQELADALYFVASSGVPVGKAMGVVKVTAKAAALGLGDTKVVADAVTSAMNAYRKSGLSAADATNTLAQAVKLGKGEPEELAASIGRVIPVASKLGVPFHDVAAALASMTLQGLDAAEATTALRGIFSATFKETKDGAAALKGVGLTYQDIRDSLDKRGTLKTLEMLSTRLHGNVESMAAVFPNIRALVGAFNLTGDSAKRNAQIFDDMSHKTQMVQVGFQRLSKTDAFKLRQELSSLQASAIQVGTALVPVVDDIGRVIGSLASGFASMPTFARDILIGAVVLGPAIRGLGFLATAIGGVGKAIEFLAGTSLAGSISGMFGKSEALITARLWGMELAGALGGAIPLTFAAVGVGNIIVRAITGDTKGALASAGGALAGALAGFLIGGLPGALIGGGIGSVLGGVIGDLFSSSKHLSRIQQGLRDSAASLHEAMSKDRTASRALADSSRNLQKAHERAHTATKRLHNAEAQLEQARKKYPANSRLVREAEAKVAIAKDNDRQATNKLKNAEKLHGVELQAARASLRLTISQEKDHINWLQDERRRTLQLFNAQSDKVRQDKQQHASSAQIAADQRELARRGRDLMGADDKLSSARKQYNDTLSRAAKEVNPAFAKSLKNMTAGEIQFGRQIVNTRHVVDPYKGTLFNSLINPQEQAGKTFHDSAGKVHAATAKMGDSLDSLAKVAYTGEKNIQDNTNKSLAAFGAKKLSFALVPPKGAKGHMHGGQVALAMGGLASIVPGAESGDRHLLSLNGVPIAKVESREGVFVGNRTLMSALGQMNDEIPRRQDGGFVDLWGKGMAHLAKGGQASPYHFPLSGSWSWGRTDMGVDFGGAPTIGAIGSGTVIGTGAPGWPGGHGVQYRMDAGAPSGYSPSSADIYVNENLSERVQPGQKISAGEVIAKAGGSYPFIEMGWATSSGAALAAPHYSEGDVTAEGSSFKRFLQALLGGKGVMGGAGAVAHKIAREIVKGPDGPLKNLVQAALDKAWGSANDYIAAKAPKGTTGAPGPGAPPPSSLPPSLRQFDHRWAAHWAPDYGGPTMPVVKIEELAEWAGMPGVTMAQIAHGESGYRPGSAGVDPGGTKGYGMWAITSPFADQYVGPYGGYPGMWNPISNALVAKQMYDARGIAPWYGTRYLTGSNLHYNGPMKQQGGFVDLWGKGLAHLAGGGAAWSMSDYLSTLQTHLAAPPLVNLYGNAVTSNFLDQIAAMQVPAQLGTLMAQRARGIDVDADYASRASDLTDLQSGSYDKLDPALQAAMEQTQIASQLGLLKTGAEQFAALKGSLYALLPPDAQQALAMLDDAGYLVPERFQSLDELGWLRDELQQMLELRNEAISAEQYVDFFGGALAQWGLQGWRGVHGFQDVVTGTRKRKGDIASHIADAIGGDEQHLTHLGHWLHNHPVALRVALDQSVAELIHKVGFDLSDPGPAADEFHRLQQQLDSDQKSLDTDQKALAAEQKKKKPNPKTVAQLQKKLAADQDAIEKDQRELGRVSHKDGRKILIPDSPEKVAEIVSGETDGESNERVLMGILEVFQGTESRASVGPHPWWERLADEKRTFEDERGQKERQKLLRIPLASERWAGPNWDDPLRKLRWREYQYRQYLGYLTGDPDYGIQKAPFWERATDEAQGHSVLAAIADQADLISSWSVPGDFSYSGSGPTDLLRQLQGIGSTMDILTQIPDIGVLGGDFLSLQKTIATWAPEQKFDTGQLFTPEGGDTGTGGTGSTAGLSISQLQSFAEALRYGAFNTVGYGGGPGFGAANAMLASLPAHHGGGIVEGRPAGTAEVLRRLLPGEGVIDRETMASGLPAAGGRWEFVITNWRDGTGYMRRLAGDEIKSTDRAKGERWRAGAAAP